MRNQAGKSLHSTSHYFQEVLLTESDYLQLEGVAIFFFLLLPPLYPWKVHGKLREGGAGSEVHPWWHPPTEDGITDSAYIFFFKAISSRKNQGEWKTWKSWWMCYNHWKEQEQDYHNFWGRYLSLKGILKISQKNIKNNLCGWSYIVVKSIIRNYSTSRLTRIKKRRKMRIKNHLSIQYESLNKLCEQKRWGKKRKKEKKFAIVPGYLGVILLPSLSNSVTSHLGISVSSA